MSEDLVATISPQATIRPFRPFHVCSIGSPGLGIQVLRGCNPAPLSTTGATSNHQLSALIIQLAALDHLADGQLDAGPRIGGNPGEPQHPPGGGYCFFGLNSIGTGHRSVHLQGNLNQSARERVMERFRSGKVPILVATNVAACGLDIEGIDQVINFDLPDSRTYFTHSTGRTGRMGIVLSSDTFADIRNASAYDMTSRAQTLHAGQFLVLQNGRGYYAAVRVEGVKDRLAGDPYDEVTIVYRINSDGSELFKE